MNQEQSMDDQTINSQSTHESVGKRETAVPADNNSPEQPGTRQAEAANSKTPEPIPPQRKRRQRLILAGAALAAAVATATYYYSFVAPYESTDDAFIEAHVTPIASQVSGRVEQLFVDDNQQVTNGEILLKIDPRDYQAKLDQVQGALAAAKGQLEEASAQFIVDQAKVKQEKANVVAAEAEAAWAEADDKRYQAVGPQAASKSQVDLAATQARSTTAQVDAAKQKELAAEAQVTLDQAAVQTAEADVQKSEADVRQAELNLSYTEVRASEDGYVTHRTVEQGAYIEPGQALLALVPRNVWVVANFKETQLTHMRPGQPVEVHVDAYPKVKFQGHVDSVEAGSGAYFSLLPPENASGNYVKVVQRVPVKIVLNEVPESGIVLGPGMSVEPSVRVK